MLIINVMKNEIKNEIKNAVEKFATVINGELINQCDDISWQDAVVGTECKTTNSKEGFSAFYDFGYRSIIRLQNRIDLCYNICKEQTSFIDKEIENFNNFYFDELNEEERNGATSISDYLENCSEDELEIYDNSLWEHLWKTHTKVVIDTWYYAKDNTFNKSGKDVVLVQVHINYDDSVRYISKTGKDAYIAVFEAKDFIEMMNGYEKLEIVVKKIFGCLSGEAFIDPQSDLID